MVSPRPSATATCYLPMYDFIGRLYYCSKLSLCAEKSINPGSGFTEYLTFAPIAPVSGEKAGDKEEKPVK